MAPKANLTKVANITVDPREIDFVSRFANNFEALREILGITRPVRKEPGAILRVMRASVTLQDSVGEGEEIPYSQAAVVQIPVGEATVEKYAKGVSIEAIKNYGYDVAVARTDDAFLGELQSKVSDKMYTFLATGELTNIQSTFQSAVAMARGLVLNQFKKMHKGVTDVVGFVNILDFYTYLGGSDITVQTAFGLNYVKDFMGYNTIFLGSDNEIASGKVIATPAENMVAYYVDPSSSDFARAGLVFTSWGDTPLLGYHTEGNYSTMVSESFAIMGLSLFAEYINGIAVVTVEASGSIGSISGFSTASTGSTAGACKVTVPDADVNGGKFYFKAQASTAPSAPTYLSIFDPTGYTEVEDGDVITATNGHKYRLVEVNGSGQVISTADGTVTSHT